jgi:uncharacterized membrane protein YhiD involved in acid resistance
MAIGMAVGTRFYALAMLSTVAISFIIWFMFRTDMFANKSRSNILRVRMAPDLPPEIVLEAAFERYLRRHNLIASESVQGGLLNEHVYEVDLKDEHDTAAFLNQLREITNNNKVVIIRGYHEVNI